MYVLLKIIVRREMRAFYTWCDTAKSSQRVLLQEELNVWSFVRTYILHSHQLNKINQNKPLYSR